jgi:hypothetical protein
LLEYAPIYAGNRPGRRVDAGWRLSAAQPVRYAPAGHRAEGISSMIFWRGAGIFTFIIFLLAVAAIWAENEVLHIRSAALSAGTMAVAGVANWFAGNALNRDMREAGTSPFQRHSFFFLPMEWWSLGFIAFAIWGFFNFS